MRWLRFVSAGGNRDVEIEEGDTQEKQNRRFVVHRLKLHDPENETFPIPLKYVDVMRQTQTSIILNQLSMIHGPKRRVSIFLRNKWVNGRPTKIQKTTRPDSIWW